MMKERYRSMMEQVSLSEQAKAGLLEKLEEKRPAKRSVRVLRAALIAACACVALIGGAFAAELITGAGILEFFTGRPDIVDGTPRDGFDVSFPPMKEYSAAEFSEELKSWLAIPREERKLTKSFEDWEDAEEFLGIELINNPVLDEFGKEFVSDKHCWGVFFDAEGQLKRAEVRAYYSYKEKGCDVAVTAGIITDQCESICGDGFWTVYLGANNGELLAEQYVTPSGLAAAIVKSELGHDAYLTVNGVAFRISVLNEPIEVIQEILNAIEV